MIVRLEEGVGDFIADVRIDTPDDSAPPSAVQFGSQVFVHTTSRIGDPQDPKKPVYYRGTVGKTLEVL